MKKKTNKVIFIGAIDVGKIATNGETMKNQMLLRRFEALFDKVLVVDAYQWRKRPWCLIQLLLALIGNRGAKVVVSASGAISYLYKLLYYIPLKRDVYDWVIGGSRAVRIKQGVYSKKTLGRLKKIIVEGESMVTELNSMGLNNVVCVPNFKPVEYIPSCNNIKEEYNFRFVFLSRVHPDKGIREIVEACNILNEKGNEGRYIVDFYGPISLGYEEQFKSMISPYKNLHYCGFLNLMNNEGYEKLSSYDVMLFPTYWDGEGFPGVAIDAYMTGIPIIASDWNMNNEVVDEGRTGFIIPVHDSKALADRMNNFIVGTFDLKTMRNNCIQQAKLYDYRNVVTRDLLVSLGLLED